MSSNCTLWRVAILIAAGFSLGARYQTPNFVVDAPTPAIAKQVGEAAELYRKELAKQWLGYTLPRWYAPCHVIVHVGNVGAGGATTFSFQRGSTGQMEVFGWRMNIQGPLNRIIDSVLPHEVTHTILATYFRRPLPRWADEGAATLAEHPSEKQRLINKALRDLPSARRIPLNVLLSQTEYPQNMDQVLTLYAEGYLLADFLVRKRGRRCFLQFVQTALARGWETAIRKYYGFASVSELERTWQNWVLAGGPLPAPGGLLAQLEQRRRAAAEAVQLASATQSSTAHASNVVIRSQTPERPLPKWRVRPPRRLSLAGIQAAKNLTYGSSREEAAGHAIVSLEKNNTVSSAAAKLGTAGWTSADDDSSQIYGRNLHAPAPRTIPFGAGNNLTASVPSTNRGASSNSFSSRVQQPRSAFNDGWVPARTSFPTAGVANR